MIGRVVQHVYFAEACGKIKIGCSFNVEARLRSVSEWIPFPITVLATMRGSTNVEGAIHRMFDDEWSHGEWFVASDRLRAFCDDIAKGRPVVIDTTLIATRRNAFIADKKRLTRRIARLHKAGGALPPAFVEQLETVPKGTAIPNPLLTSVNDFIDTYLARAA